jgi:hypothetical protein
MEAGTSIPLNPAQGHLWTAYVYMFQLNSFICKQCKFAGQFSVIPSRIFFKTFYGKTTFYN